jgi:hypothetical protein
MPSASTLVSAAAGPISAHIRANAKTALVSICLSLYPKPPMSEGPGAAIV